MFTSAVCPKCSRVSSSDERASAARLAAAPEHVVETIREVHVRKFPATQTWHIYFTNKRIIFQVASGGTEEVLFGIVGGLVTMLFRSLRKRKAEMIRVEDILSKQVPTLSIDSANRSRMTVERRRIIIQWENGKEFRFDVGSEKMTRFQQLANDMLQIDPRALA
ncbi:MAG: hypothetical protein ABSF95_17995 [Verrucomicrobiota bacterium]